MPSTRTTAGAALAVTVGALLAAAGGVSEGLPTAVAVEQRPVAGGEGLSPYALFVMLVVRVLALFGVSVELNAASAAGGSWLTAAVGALRVAGPIFASLLFVGSVGWMAVRARRWRRSRRQETAKPDPDFDASEGRDDVQRPPANTVESNWADVVGPGNEDEAARTPRELAAERANAGAPEDAVSGLTRLFRAVRYGGREATRERSELAAEFARAVRDEEGDDGE
jgi:hypothetical protein